MKKVKSIERKVFGILPPKLGRCPECAGKHEINQPHNKDSLYYQMQFQMKYGRWPTWEDAMAHCDEKTKGIWYEELEKIKKST